MSALFTLLVSWIQPGTLSLVGVLLLWQQVRFLNQRLDEFGKRMEELKQDTNTKLDRINARLDRTDAKLDRTNARLDRTDTKLDHINARLDRTDTKLDHTNARLDRTDAKLDRTDAKLDRIIDILLINSLQASQPSTAAGAGEVGSSTAPELTEHRPQAS